MATDIKIFSENGDIGLENGDLAVIKDGLEVIQSTTIRLLFLLGECIWDITLGTPWLQKMFKTEISLEEKKRIARNRLIGTQNFKRLTKFNFYIDPVNQGGQIEFQAETDFGVVESEVII